MDRLLVVKRTSLSAAQPSTRLTGFMGHSFTLSGSSSDPGIIPLSIADLFAGIRSTPDREFLLRASYLELYNETILDLLSSGVSKELSLSEGKKKGDIIINGLTECGVRTEEEVRRLLKKGEERRKVGGTDWNQRSSRSHCVFRIVSTLISVPCACWCLCSVNEWHGLSDL